MHRIDLKVHHGSANSPVPLLDSHAFTLPSSPPSETLAKNVLSTQIQITYSILSLKERGVERCVCRVKGLKSNQYKASFGLHNY